MTYLVLALSSALAAAPPSGPPPGEGHHGGPPPMSEMVLHAVDDLDLDATVQASVDKLAAAARAELDADRTRCRTAHDALDAALGADSPNRATVLAAVRTFDAADAALQERDLLLVVDIAAAIGPDAWAEVRDQLPPPGGPPSGGRGGRDQ